MEYIKAKTILQKSNYKDEWFGIDYYMNLYKGCSHGCIYCDSRSNCYNIENFDTVRAKENEIEILKAELTKKRKKGIIGIGAMSDSYNPLEKKYKITRQALKEIEKQGFGVSIETKSDLIVRDIDIYEKINQKANLILKFSITTADDELSKIIEPHVCVTSERFKAINKISNKGIFVGVLLSPILPFITDSEENIRKIIKLSAENGAKFVFSMGGVTLRENQREYFYNQLDKYFPELKTKYIKTYGDKYFCDPINSNIYNIFKEECKKYGLLYKMKDIIKEYKTEKEVEQLTLF